MDTSKEYIDMCKKAKEIQDLWNPSAGDWIYSAEQDRLFCLGDEIFDDGYVFSPRDYGIPLRKAYPDIIWLPRQDQLQEMVDCWADRDFINREMNYFANWVYFHTDDPTSWEKFWLVFVMWVKYKKIWDKEADDWIKKEV